MPVSQEIKDAYVHYRYLLDGKLGEFPFDTEPDIVGGTHLEMGDDGSMALVTMERGKEVQRLVATSVEELMYLVFKKRVNAMAFRARPPVPAPKEHAVALISKIDPAWGSRLAREQGEEAKETAEMFRRLRES